MFFQTSSVTALAALTFLSQASGSIAAHARSHRHYARAFDNKDGIFPRDAGSVSIPVGEFQQLQSEITSFKSWMNDYTNTANTLEPAAALAQLKQEFQAFDGWLTDFLNNVVEGGPTSVRPLPSTKPLVANPDPTILTILSTSASVPSITPVAPTGVAPKESSVDAPATSAPGSVTAPNLIKSQSSSKPTVPPPVTIPTGGQGGQIISSSSAPAAPSASSAAPLPITPVSSAASAPSSPPSTGGGSGGSFNAGSSSNLAVYYGQSPDTSSYTLAQQCQDASNDIVILAFVSDFFGKGGYPTLNLGSACNNGPSAAQTAKGATGLLSCPKIADDIKTCQAAGKKVLLSLGGSAGTSALPSSGQADEFAKKLWDLFGGGTGESKDMRPFGDAKVDGFDIDNEDHSTANYAQFVSSLRKTYSSDSTKQYYISAAPQCPRPDASIPLDAMQTMDFVFVQFYNNAQAGCNVGQPGFVDSLKAWSSDLAKGGKGPKLYVGAPGCSACAGAGYVEPGQIGSVIASAKSANLPNFGGAMLWDGPSAKKNGDYGAAVKKALA